MIKHAYSNPTADGTATTVVRPSDWNSAHVQQVSISGNTSGVSSFTARDVVFQGGNNLTLSASVAGAVATMLFSAADAAALTHTHSQYLTTAAQSDHTHSQYLTTAAATDVTTNNMATAERGNYFYMSNNTFANSTHTHGNVAFSGTNVSGSFTSASNGLSIQLSASAGGVGGGAALSAGTQSANTGTVAFANSNGISFGMSGSNQITAQHNALTTAAQSNHSHNFATTTTNGSQIVVATTNSAGATIAVPPFITTAQAPGAYLTTARASNDAIGLNTALTANGVSVTANSSGLSINVPAFLTTAALSGDTTKYAGTSTGFTGGASISGSMTHNTAGLAISLSHPAWLTTAAQSSASNVSGVVAGTNATGGTATLSGNVSFSNANGVSFYTSAGNAIAASVKTDYLTTAMASNAGSNFVGLNSALTGNGVSATINSSGVSLNVPAFLTTAAQSGHSHGNPTLNLTNLSGTTASNSAGFTLSLSANVGGGGDGYNIVQLGTTGTTGTSWSSQTAMVQINGSQNITVSQNNSNQIVIVGPSLAPYLTTAALSGDTTKYAGTSSGFTGGAAISGSMTHNTAGLAISLSHPAWLTTAALSADSSKYAGTSTGFTGGASLSASMTHNTAGLAISMSHPAWLTTAALSGDTTKYAGLGTTFGGANISGSMTLNTAGLNLSLSGAGGGTTNQTGPNMAAGTQTATSGTVLFANSNHVTFGMSGSTQITASFDPVNIGMSTNGNTAGTTGTFDGGGLQYIFAGGNNITLSQSANASSVTLSIHGAGAGGFTRSYLDNLGPLATASGAMGTKLVQDKQVQVFPLKPFQDLFNGSMTLNTVVMEVSCSGSTATLSAAGISTVLRFGLYALDTTGGTLSLSLINSFGKTFGLAGGATNNSTYWQGQRLISVHSSEWSSQPVLSNNGQYFCGIHWSSIGSSAQTFAMMGAFAGSTAGRSGFLGSTTANATWNGAFGPFMGVYGTTTGALPTGINYTQVNKQSASANFIPHIIAYNYTNLTML